MKTSVSFRISYAFLSIYIWNESIVRVIKFVSILQMCYISLIKNYICKMNRDPAGMLPLGSYLFQPLHFGVRSQIWREKRSCCSHLLAAILGRVKAWSGLTCPGWLVGLVLRFRWHWRIDWSYQWDHPLLLSWDFCYFFREYFLLFVLLINLATSAVSFAASTIPRWYRQHLTLPTLHLCPRTRREKIQDRLSTRVFHSSELQSNTFFLSL